VQGQNNKPTFLATMRRELARLWPVCLVLLGIVVVPALVVIGILKAIGVR
jgi:hypothetical protein